MENIELYGQYVHDRTTEVMPKVMPKTMTNDYDEPAKTMTNMTNQVGARRPNYVLNK